MYQATDTKLGRSVAIKFLPEAFSHDTERVARFQREARLLASLNHSNIAAIYGVEEIDSRHFLVMELITGETLADRIKRGAIPIDEALPIAKQIAEALEEAHEKGIIHRDLKPANIKVTPDGKVKVLDFGLAKAYEPEQREVTASNSPTMMSMAATRAGTILGTAAYMSPEQARGKFVDKRTDIWAFGCVLYEMLTGRRAFEGDGITDILARILEREPDFNALPPTTPPTIRRLLRRSLEKDRKRRLSDASDARFEIDEALAATASDRSRRPTLDTVQPTAWRRVAALAAALLLGSILTGTVVWLATRPTPPRVARLMITPPGTAALAVNGFDRDVAISPDGTRLVYVGGNGSRLFLRTLDRVEATPLEGLGVPHHPFFSPDGTWIGFFDGIGALKKVPVNGGPAVTICRVTAAPTGATWGLDGTIIFAINGTPGLLRVAANGGEPEVLTTPNEQQGEAFYTGPEFLPEGRGVLFVVGLAGGGTQIGVLDLRTDTRKILVRDGFYARYVSTGHLVYGVSGALRAVLFDLDRLEVAGTPIPLAEPVLVTPFGRMLDFDVSQSGTLVYVPAGTQVAARTLMWLDRQGREESIKAPVRAYTYPRLSPDGMRLALDVRDQENDIWIWNFARETLTRLTFDPGADQYPVWTPDGRRLVFDSGRAGTTTNNLFWQMADGAGTAEQLTKSSIPQFPYAISPDGTRVVFRADAPKTGQDLMMLTLDKERSVKPLVQTAFNELNAEISPDGRWFAYESNESGQYEIYVRPFPDATGGRWQISTGGGTKPLWARDGQELFYVTPTGALMSARIERRATFSVGAPTKLFEGGHFYVGAGINTGRTYDISADGRRFLMMKADTSTPTSVVVVLNWFEELKQRVPVK